VQQEKASSRTNPTFALNAAGARGHTMPEAIKTQTICSSASAKAPWPPRRHWRCKQVGRTRSSREGQLARVYIRRPANVQHRAAGTTSSRKGTTWYWLKARTKAPLAYSAG